MTNSIRDLRDCIYETGTLPSIVKVFDAATGIFSHYEKPDGTRLSRAETLATNKRNGGKPQPIRLGVN